MEIRENFIDKNGILYPNIREIAFTRDNLFGNLGTLVNETKREVNDYFAIFTNILHLFWLFCTAKGKINRQIKKHL